MFKSILKILVTTLSILAISQSAFALNQDLVTCPSVEKFAANAIYLDVSDRIDANDFVVYSSNTIQDTGHAWSTGVFVKAKSKTAALEKGKEVAAKATYTINTEALMDQYYMAYICLYGGANGTAVAVASVDGGMNVDLVRLASKYAK